MKDKHFMKKITAFIFFGFPIAYAANRHFSKSEDTIILGIVNVTHDLESLISEFQDIMITRLAGRNKKFEFLYKGRGCTLDTLEPEIDSLLEANPDIVISFSTPVTLKVKNRFTKTETPIVFALVVQPVKTGIVRAVDMHLAINLKTARKIGLDIPEELLHYAPIYR